MCKAPSPPKPQEPKKPQFLRNKYLDEFVGDAQAVKSLKTGRSSLRIPQGEPAVGGRQIGEPLGITPGPSANVAPANGDFRPIGPRSRTTSNR